MFGRECCYIASVLARQYLLIDGIYSARLNGRNIADPPFPLSIPFESWRIVAENWGSSRRKRDNVKGVDLSSSPTEHERSVRCRNT